MNYKLKYSYKKNMTKKIEIEMITTKEKRRKTSEDNGKETLPRIKNEQVLGDNTINKKLVKESSSKSHAGEFIKQKHVSSRDTNNSKTVCNRNGSNLMNAFTAISTNNQKSLTHS